MKGYKRLGYKFPVATAEVLESWKTIQTILLDECFRNSILFVAFKNMKSNHVEN